MRPAPLAGLLLLLCTAALGQTDATPPGPVTPADGGKSGEAKDPGPEPKDTKTDREFKPTEELSPDQEVDFPADL